MSETFAVIDEVRSLWAALAAAPVTFTDGRCDVVVSERSLLCPTGWAGIVVIGSAAIATAPDTASADLLRQALHDIPPSSAAAPELLAACLGIEETRGPAALAYLDTADFRPANGPAAQQRDIAKFLSDAALADAEESGLDEITSPAFAVVEEGEVVAAAGYRDWPGNVAHFSVLTAPRARGRGLARAAASAAVVHALAAGKLPQWRARPESSRRVARALGFTELGVQVSIRLRRS